MLETLYYAVATNTGSYKYVRVVKDSKNSRTESTSDRCPPKIRVDTRQ